MKIAVYTICKNEAKQVEPFLASCRDADRVSVADTGSTDGTPDLLHQHGAIVHHIAVTPWRFDLARTAALTLLPADVDVCVPLDLDERLTPGWRQELERCWVPGTTRLRYWYTWNWKAPGVPDVVFRIDRIHARAGYFWRHPTHEILASYAEERIADSELAIHQFPEAKPRPDDLTLLEEAVREDHCAQTVFYLAREHFLRERWAEALPLLEQYLALPDARWKPERSHAYRMIGLCKQHLGDREGSRAGLLQAVAEHPGLRENWIDLAQWYHDRGDWAGGYHACGQALAIRERSREYFSFGDAWGERADDLASICAWHLGLKEKAAEHLRAALAANPINPRLQGNARFILNPYFPDPR
jgi:glycosyltransferase involved in cell wall biosynthesis